MSDDTETNKRVILNDLMLYRDHCLQTEQIQVADMLMQTISFIEKLIAEHEAARGMEWVSVDERLPEDGQFVRVVGIPDGMINQVTQELTYRDKVGFIRNVTHWHEVIPLPPLPTGESDEQV